MVQAHGDSTEKTAALARLGETVSARVRVHLHDAHGEVLNPRTDHRHRTQLIGRAGVPDRRLPDACHTAATVLLLLGVTERTVMGVRGWSDTAMTARYQQLTAAIRRDVADRVGGLLWQSPADPGEGDDGPPAPA